MHLTSLTATLALALHITTCIAAYSVTAFAGGNCNIGGPTGASITAVGANANTFTAASCAQVPFQGLSVSVTGCTSGGAVGLFTDGECITPASVPIPDTGILCLHNTAFKSFSVTGC
ncbi:hypothetical protein BJ912DRAFT_968263 [Pholiota molesta]|nr:hypothetical protein BJ912DRAFT_968263 [Pholiota molesta]